MVCKYFLPFHGLPLHSIDSVLWCTEVFNFFLKFIYLFIYLWLCWVFVSVRGLSPAAASGGHSSSLCADLSLLRPLLLRSTGSRCVGSVIVAHGPSCSAACEIFPDQGSNPCPLCWQAYSQPLRHQGSPEVFNFDEVQLTYFFLLLSVLLLSYPRNRCQCKSWSISPLFLEEFCSFSFYV